MNKKLRNIIEFIHSHANECIFWICWSQASSNTRTRCMNYSQLQLFKVKQSKECVLLAGVWPKPNSVFVEIQNWWMNNFNHISYFQHNYMHLVLCRRHISLGQSKRVWVACNATDTAGTGTGTGTLGPRFNWIPELLFRLTLQPHWLRFHMTDSIISPGNYKSSLRVKNNKKNMKIPSHCLNRLWEFELSRMPVFKRGINIISVSDHYAIRPWYISCMFLSERMWCDVKKAIQFLIELIIMMMICKYAMDILMWSHIMYI